MKGLKFWAVLGGVAVATGCLSTSVSANEPKNGASNPAPFNELEAGSSKRGVRLDELFKYFDQKPAPSAATSVKTAASSSVSHKSRVHAKGPVSQSKRPVIAGNKPAQQKEKRSDIQTAVYTHANTGKQTQLTVAGGGLGSQSSIISACLDKPGALPSYKSGDRMVVKLTAAADCNVLVFDYDSKGTLTQLFPNEFETSGTLRANQTVEIGGADSKYTLDVAGKGIERIFVYAYPISEQPITVAMNAIPHTPFRSVEITPDQYKRLVSDSRTYFEKPSYDRSVKITPKAGAQPVSTSSVESDKQPNKLELTFQIDK